MGNKTARLFFIDAMRAWAILMMLQGHFVDGLLENAFRDPDNLIFTIWKYFRGITAPVFFTVSGFIFTYLLIRVPEKGFDNPRIKKGIKRGIQLLFIGYLLRLNIFGLLKGELYSSFFLVDVLHIIGLSILGIIGLYLLTYKRKKYIFPLSLLIISCLLFSYEPVYSNWTFQLLPDAMANYFTRTNGSVFTIIPWFGYTAIGGFFSYLFTQYKNYKFLYPAAISIAALAGTLLIFFSSNLFLAISSITGIQLFEAIATNNYLFIRLGDVLIAFAVFMLLRQFITSRMVLRIGQNTLSIYVIHFIILYGSFTGLGLYRFFYQSLSPAILIPAVIAFMFACTSLSLFYARNEDAIKQTINIALQDIGNWLEPWLIYTQRTLKITIFKILRSIGFVKS
ncbi:heparan-alpha-glucosaminide N-acetyltransferase domain-containing protein [uncultured Eudoraea sp.]|uniref:heparan-alpha-glucosaminide N-acetyltransferase domain-containing protein n=1 Tax=uncultured Eudoraea sp. TaxID=1035614 RepID=UPI00261C903A|nr:heparan-alpha-glucosaminide N-acetyltransferase domain-containing protein [uncultured Eudoraea sp.]